MLNIIYHYFPHFREPIFTALARKAPEAQFIYGANSRFGVAALTDEAHHVRRNFFFGSFIFQTFRFSDLKRAYKGDCIIIGDIKFLNSWIYAVVARMGGRRVLFWTHGVLEKETGFKSLIRKCYYKIGHGLLLYSQHEACLLREMGFNRPIYVIGNSNYGVADLARLRDIAYLNKGDGACYIGRISVDKGSIDFLELARELPDCRIFLVGPIDYRSSDFLGEVENIEVCAPEYSLDRLKAVTSQCGSHVIFRAAGLSLFTALLLNKRLFVKRCYPQKPEYHLLDEFGLIESFDDIAELIKKLEKPGISETDFLKSRLLFLKEYTAEAVADRILSALELERKERL